MLKKAQASWSFEELGRFVLRIIAFLLLLMLLLSLVSIFTKPKTVDAARKDLIRVISEIRDLETGEQITVPVLSNDYRIFVRSIEDIIKAGVSGCRINEGEYCACIKNLDDEIINCISFDLIDDSKIKSTDITLNSNKGVSLSSAGGFVQIN